MLHFLFINLFFKNKLATKVDEIIFKIIVNRSIHRSGSASIQIVALNRTSY